MQELHRLVRNRTTVVVAFFVLWCVSFVYMAPFMPSSSVRWLFHAAHVAAALGTIVYLMLLFRARGLEQQERALQVSHDKCQVILDHIYDGYYEINKSGAIVSYNGSLYEILGCSKHELENSNLFEVMGRVHRRDIAEVFFRVADTGIPVKAHAWEYIRPDGKRMYLEASIKAMQGETGECVGYRGIIRNITARKIAELELRESEQLLRDVIEAIPDCVMLKSPDGRWMKANRAVLDLYGMRDAYIEGMTGDEFARSSPIYGQVYGKFRLAMEDVWQRGNVAHTEEKFPGRNGEQDRCFSVTRVPLYYEDGTRKGIVVIGRDITGIRQTQARLIESEQRYRSLFERNGDAILSFDLNGTCLSVNPQTAGILGYGEELVGRSIYEVLPADEVEELLGVFRNVRYGMVEHTFSTTHKAGHVIELFVKSVPFEIDGQFAGSFVIVRDVTEHNRMLRENQRLSWQNDLILQSAAEAICGVDLQGRLWFANPALCRITGYELDELVGSDFYALLHHSTQNGEPYPRESCSIFRALHDGKVHLVEDEVFWGKDGQAISVEYVASPMVENGEIAGVVVICRDVTEKRKTHELFVQSEKLAVAGQLAAGIAHEIRNPLTVLMGFLDLIQRERAHPYIPIMLSETKRIESILNEFLMIAKPASEVFRPANPVALMTDILSLVTTQAALFNVQLLTDMEDGIPDIVCDENRLKQVFLNVFKNAIEAMPKGGNLHLQMFRESDTGLVVRIRDEGCGIPKDKLARLGVPFFTTKEKGTGLGLSVCFRIVQSHGGVMTLHSEEGRGTVVEVKLPIGVHASV